MSQNHKLTAILEGKTIASTAFVPGRLVVTMDDGCLLSINGSLDAAASGTIGTITQTLSEMTIATTTGIATIALTENPAVLVRDAAGKLLYAD